MVSSKKWLVSLVTFFLVVASTAGQEGHHNGTVTAPGNETQTEYKVDPGLISGDNTAPDRLNDDYEANNNDGDHVDYKDVDNLETMPQVVKSPTNATNSTAPESEPPASIPANGDLTVNNATLSANNSTNQTDSQPPPAEVQVPDNKSENEVSKPAEGVNAVPNNTSESVTTAAKKEETTETTKQAPVNETVPSSSTEQGPQPIPVITEGVGDSYTNYTASPGLDSQEGAESGGIRTWPVVAVSVLISFAAIFTVLFFLREALLRRRKADQLRLLRGSISSEGYFYGDTDGHIPDSKFEL